MTFPQPTRDVVRSVTISGLSALAVLVAAASTSRATGALPAEAEYGTIKGRLVWGGDEIPKPAMVEVTKDTEVCGTRPRVASKELVVDPNTKGVGNAFAYLLKPNGANPEAEKALLDAASEVTIDQKKCEYIPYSTAMHQNQTMVFKSSDPTNHNVHYQAFKNNAFNQVLPPNGEAKVKLVAEPRPIPLTCDLHPWMRGAIMVFDHPFFAVTNDDGSFEIKGVPAGEQKLVVRLSNGVYVSQTPDHSVSVMVQPGKTAEVEVKIDPAIIKK
jgi:hypothetical protein